MNITIQIGARASKQSSLINAIPGDFISRKDNSVTINGVYEENKRVKDVFRYNIIIEDNSNPIVSNLKGDLGLFGDNNVSQAKGRVIVLILESPHRDEYSKDFEPIAPAQGKTGEKIHKYIGNVISQFQSSLSPGNYSFIICNPVQFQASLYYYHKQSLHNNSPACTIRNKVWFAIYEYEKHDFFKRLLSYKPITIINACTYQFINVISNDLRQINFPKRELPSIYRASCHPSSWTSSISLKNEMVDHSPI